MTTFDDLTPDESDDFQLLSPEESLDDEVTGDTEDGYFPPDRPLGSTAWGITWNEMRSREDLSHRLAREQPEPVQDETDGLGDASDTDGELIDDQVGDAQAGQLVEWEAEIDSRSDYWARDAGLDLGAVSAEESAIHIVPDSPEYGN